MNTNALIDQSLKLVTLPDGAGRADLLLSVVTGSRAYGLHRADSDYDIFHVVAPTPDMLLGRDNWESAHRQGTDFDVKVYSFAHYFNGLCKGSVNHLETLFLPPLLRSTHMAVVFNYAHRFITARTLDGIIGHVYSTLRRFRDVDAAQHGGKRRELIKSTGYDTSAATHAIRWLWIGQGLWQDPTRLTLTLDPLNETLLRAVKRGECDPQDVEDMMRANLNTLESMVDEIVPKLNPFTPRQLSDLQKQVHLSVLKWHGMI